MKTVGAQKKIEVLQFFKLMPYIKEKVEDQVYGTVRL